MMQSEWGWRRPLIVGASGQVGVALCRALQQHGGVEVLETGREPGKGRFTLDLAALQSAADAAGILDPLRPDVILCAGAMTYVDGCEADPKQAFRVNAHGPSALAAYARSRGLPFVFFSSDYVFEGTEEDPGPYVEADLGRPLNVYGWSKLQGEGAVLRVHPRALVVRTSWVYGPDAAGKNFVSSLVRQLRAGQRVRVPMDQVSTPTLNLDLARATLALLAARASGVVHVAGAELMSRLELAQRIAAFFELDGRLLEGVETAALGQRAKRPLRSGLRSERLHVLAPEVRLHSLQEGLGLTSSTLRP